MRSKMQESEFGKVCVEQLALGRINPDSDFHFFIARLEHGRDIAELTHSARKGFERKPSGLQSDGVRGRVILAFSAHNRSLRDTCGDCLGCTKSVVLIRSNGIAQTQERFLPVRLMTHTPGESERHCRWEVNGRLT